MKKNLPDVSNILISSFKSYRKLFSVVFALLISLVGFAHEVTNYSSNCAAGQQYTVTATVINVINTSNYRWQWKNTSGAWECFVNGSNNINGTSYNVSGAVFNLTTTPGPIIFTNPTSGLQNLEIRMVISDGSGVNPCTLPAGNTWTSATNHFINVTGTGCVRCNASVTGLYFNRLDGGADLPITNGSTFTVAQLSSLYNLEASTSGTVGSVKYTITGPTPTTNIENTAPYNSPGTGSGAWTGVVGTYNVNLKTYSSAHATGTLCHETTITFNLIDNTCSCPGNIVQNPSFENGTTNWSSSGGTLAAGNGGVACGSFSGDLNNTSANSKAWQNIGTDLFAGTVVNVSVHAGTHDNRFNNFVAVEFLDAANVVLGTSVYIQVDKILANAPVRPQLYTFSATVPAGAKYTRVAFGGNGSYTKTDQWCVTLTQPITGSIGDRVWFDADGDGIQDASETIGITGVTVQLRNAAGTVIATTTTNASGNYLFSGLAAGNYTVGFPISISGAIVTTQNAGADDNIDSDASQATGITPTIVLGAGQNITNVDAGYCPTTLVLGDRVFYDLNNNGVRDASEVGIAGLTVNLYSDANNDNVADGSFIATTTTNATGNYLFSNLAPGNYIVGVVPAAGYTSSTNPAIDPDNDVDLDDNGTNLVGAEWRGLAITLIAGTENDGTATNTDTNITYDFGFFQPVGSIGDRVWKDDNANGIQDAGEVGMAGVTLVLLNSAGQVVATTTTDANGNYLFKNLPAGNYSLRITPPANYTLSPKTQGANTNLDSDFDTNSYTTGTVTLTAGQNRTDIDAGFNFNQPQPASIGDRVWLDTNGDGLQDAGEPGVSNVLVTLYNNSGVAVASTYTDANGFYLFTDVVPGAYTVGVSLPPATVFTTNSGVVSNATNSDIIPATGRTASFAVNAGDQIRYVDAGIKPQTNTNASVGDFVWNDLNKNGIQEAGEPGIANVIVRLVNASTNTIIATTTTDAAGKYIFNDVPPGSYLIDFVTPAGYTTTTRLVTNPVSSATDSDVDPTTGRTGSFTLLAGQRILTVDAGYWVTTPPGTGKIGDRVWNDINQNGIQDAVEPSVSGITVTLYDGAGVAIKQATTDQNGNYLFTDLAAGNYTVGFSNIPLGFTFTTQGLGTAATGSDVNPATGRTGIITLAVGQVNLDVDAGVRSAQAGTSSLGNRVWYDLNNNGLQDAGEVGVQGATVELLDAIGNPIDKDPVAPGVQPTTTITNALGEYLFTGLGAADYRVRFSTLPTGYAVVTKGAGADRNLDSDGNPLAAGSSTTDLIGLGSNEDRLDIDLGIFNPTAPLGQIGDRVWFDANNNGVQDAGEQGVPGVSVTLLNAAGAVIATTVTDKDGLYKFVNLANGTYSVQFSNLPAGFNFSGKDLGGNDNADSDADPVTGRTGTYVISGGNANLTVDAGIFSTRAALGDYVWFDANRDGTQDANENGIPGITVILYDAAGVAVNSTITDQNGRYFFSNLNAGTYTVGFSTIPTTLVFTTKDAPAAGDAADSDVDPATARTGSYTLAAGQVNLTVDAGLKPLVPASIGNFVWFDTDKDGLQDAGEPGVPGIVVTLYNSANQPIGSAITDGNGAYLISNVPPGTGYYVRFSNKPDPSIPWTLQNVGGVGANDNSKVNSTGQTGAFDVAEGQNITNIDAGLIKPIVVTGNVWHDVNAMDDNLVNNSGAAQIPPAVAIPVGLRVYLVNATTGLIEKVAFVNSATGTFAFGNVNPATNYFVYMSSVAVGIGNPPPPSILPSGWQNTGQKLGTTPGSDGINDGRLAVPVLNNDVNNVNFGIRLQSGEVIIG